MPLPCFCRIRNKNKSHQKLINDLEESQEQTSTSHSATYLFKTNDHGQTVSASEVSKLKAEVWCLRNSLNDSTEANENMQVMVKKVVQEKYDALDELHKLTHENHVLHTQLAEERKLFACEKEKLLENIAELSDKTNEQQELIVSFVRKINQLPVSTIILNVF